MRDAVRREKMSDVYACQGEVPCRANPEMGEFSCFSPAPKARSLNSPGQRPGNWFLPTLRALKGRHKFSRKARNHPENTGVLSLTRMRRRGTLRPQAWRPSCLSLAAIDSLVCYGGRAQSAWLTYAAPAMVFRLPTEGARNPSLGIRPFGFCEARPRLGRQIGRWGGRAAAA